MTAAARTKKRRRGEVLLLVLDGLATAAERGLAFTDLLRIFGPRANLASAQLWAYRRRGYVYSAGERPYMRWFLRDDWAQAHQRKLAAAPVHRPLPALDPADVVLRVMRALGVSPEDVADVAPAARKHARPQLVTRPAPARAPAPGPAKVAKPPKPEAPPKPAPQLEPAPKPPRGRPARQPAAVAAPVVVRPTSTASAWRDLEAVMPPGVQVQRIEPRQDTRYTATAADMARPGAGMGLSEQWRELRGERG